MKAWHIIILIAVVAVGFFIAAWVWGTDGSDGSLAGIINAGIDWLNSPIQKIMGKKLIPHIGESAPSSSIILPDYLSPYTAT